MTSQPPRDIVVDERNLKQGDLVRLDPLGQHQLDIEARLADLHTGAAGSRRSVGVSVGRERLGVVVTVESVVIQQLGKK